MAKKKTYISIKAPHKIVGSGGTPTILDRMRPISTFQSSFPFTNKLNVVRMAEMKTEKNVRKIEKYLVTYQSEIDRKPSLI